MALPEGGRNVEWPPRSLRAELKDMAEHAAWYAGTAEALGGYYTSTSVATSGAATRAPFWRRWQSSNPGPIGRDSAAFRPSPPFYHVPLASDLATVSSDLLFAEAPEFVIPEAADGNSDAIATQERLNEIAQMDGWHNTLLEAGEYAAVYGGVYLVTAWDQQYLSHPTVRVVAPDNAMPTFRWGQLVEVTFHRQLPNPSSDNNAVYRHLESHAPGVIRHALYRGTAESLGDKVPLNDHPETEELAASLSDGDEIRHDLPIMTAEYVPNIRPNRRHGGPQGRSDFQGVESLMDALDDTMSSWMRDIRLARARLIVPYGFLDPVGRRRDPRFDIDTEVYVEANIIAGEGDKEQITAQQFEIRHEEHAATIDNLIERIVSGAGYSMQTFGEKGSGTVMTATEVVARETRSYTTRDKKARYFVPALERILFAVLNVDRLLGSGVTVFRPRVNLPDGRQDSPASLAQTIKTLTEANAISNVTKLQMLHPEWSDEEIEEEAERLNSSSPIIPNVGQVPTGGIN